ncbi:MAG TPA: hypothetical protein VLA33_02615 [Gemmatimonadota bacterium]|nr:hypothetical protein [Gemmatimonadota bacterium]
MKRRDLREMLADLDPDLEVLCYIEDPSLVQPDRTFLVLDIRAVSTPHAERTRTGDGGLQFGRSSNSERFVMFELRPTRD